MQKKDYRVTFVSGLSVTVSLNQIELYDLIHKYKVCGYESIA